MNASAFFVNATIFFTETHIPYANVITIKPTQSLSSSIVVQSMILTSNPKIVIVTEVTIALGVPMVIEYKCLILW